MAKILIAEDDRNLALSLKVTLETEKHVVEVVEDGKEAVDRLRLYSYELLILDWNLPEMEGPEVCRHYRGHGGAAPILMLTGRGDIGDRVSGLDAGVDDYLTKPFDMRELLARIRALLRRSSEYEGDILAIDPVAVDLLSRTASVRGKPIELTAKELSVLEFLMRRPDHYFLALDLLNEIWASDSDSSEMAVRQCITRLRRKLEEAGAMGFIVTSRGLGYKVESK